MKSRKISGKSATGIFPFFDKKLFLQCRKKIDYRIIEFQIKSVTIPFS